MIEAQRRERTLWRCRRGLLELDLFLTRFVERNYAQLTDEEHGAFERLLDIPDPELLDYCLGFAEPSDPQWQALVRKIRS